MIEIRYDDRRQVDEVVGENCRVHLERLDDSMFCLVLETDATRAMLNIGAPQKHRRKVYVTVYCVEPRASESPRESR